MTTWITAGINWKRLYLDETPYDIVPDLDRWYVDIWKLARTNNNLPPRIFDWMKK